MIYEVLQCLIRDLSAIQLEWWIAVILVAIAVGIVELILVTENQISKKKAITSGLLIIYVFLIFTATVFSREALAKSYTTVSSRIDLGLYSTWSRKMDAPLYVSTEPVFNVLMFIPIGFLKSFDGNNTLRASHVF